MDITLENRVIKLVIEMDADEGRKVYAELYRLAADGRVPGPLDGKLAELAGALIDAGLDS